MVPFKQILFATDFSPYADEAKQYAIDLAVQNEATLHILHVISESYVQIPDFGMGLALTGFADDLSKLQAKLEEGAKKELAAQVPAAAVEKTVMATRTGSPFVEIINYAKENDIDLIVVGTHGRTGMKHILMGSVAERVVRQAGCPVLSIRPKAWGEELVL